MEIIKKLKALAFFLIFSSNLFAHTIYAPNDIPLLDNRFRLDPKTKEVTIVLHHSKGGQDAVLVRPNGSKIFQKRHPENVAWLTTETEDIITITNPMIGPWQTIADLNKNNRITLLSSVQLNIKNLPIKLYSKELLTTTATLTENNKPLKNVNYLNGAKLSVSLTGEINKKMFLFKDNGKKYDQLAFDGELTSHLFIDLYPGRYLLNISTQNDIFVRSLNKDAIVFSTPIKLTTIVPKQASEIIQFKVEIDEEELIPTSVIIHGTLTEKVNSGIESIIINGTGPNFIISKRLTYGHFLLQVKVAATTVLGREIEIQLPKQSFTLISPESIQKRKKDKEDLLKKKAEEEKVIEPALSNSFWMVLAIGCLLLIALMISIILLLKEKIKNKGIQSESTFSDETLKEEPIDLDKL